MKLKGRYNEMRSVTFPHKTVKAHQEHVVITSSQRTMIVTCNGTVTGAQG